MADSPNKTTLEFTPTWIVAVVCSIIVLVSLFMERFLHFLGKYLKKKHQKALFEALLKVKEELMLLGFISLLLVVFQGAIGRICIPKGWNNHMLPCKKDEDFAKTSHYSLWPINRGSARHLLAENSGSLHCASKGKDPLLSSTALHHLHIFIFVLAVTHVTLSALTMLLAGEKIREWKAWEEHIKRENYNSDKVLQEKVLHVNSHDFIMNRFLGFGKSSNIVGWMACFFKQFYSSVSQSDYTTLRLGFIMMHCKGNPKFDFHRYMVRALEADFKKVVGISWYLWIFVVIFMLLNVAGWHTYFWISFIPLIILLAVGTKLEHIIVELAHEVAEKHTAIEGDLIVTPSDHYFWFGRPRLVLYLIHFILFQNAFEIAFFFWIWVQYGFDSCIMGKLRYIVPRLIIGAIIQILCSYSTLPLYAIVTQMGSSFKKVIFEEHIQDGMLQWAKRVKKKSVGPATVRNTLQTTDSTPEIEIVESESSARKLLQERN